MGQQTRQATLRLVLFFQHFLTQFFGQEWHQIQIKKKKKK